jgi:hypothetical protein
MPKLIKNISATYQEAIKDDVSLSSNITVEYADGDYQKVAGLVGFFQDYTQVDESEEFTTPTNLGLAVNRNKTFI